MTETGGVPIEPSAHQRQLWRIEYLVRGRPHLHTGPILRLDGSVDPVVLQAAIRTAARRHELLRAGFQQVAEDLRILPTGSEVALETVAAAPGEFDDPDLLRGIVTDFYHAPFAFDGAPLFRAHLVSGGPDRHVLVLPMHRLVCDAASIRTFVEDIAAAADGRPADPAPSYSETLAEDGAKLEADREYWTGVLAGYPEFRVGDLRPEGEWSPRARTVDITLPGFVEALAGQQTARRATSFALLAAAVSAVLGEAPDVDDLCLGTSFDNRWSSAAQGVVGPVSQTMLLRVRAAGQGFPQVLDQVKAAFRGALVHQRLPFDDLVAIVARQGMQMRSMLPVLLSVKPAHRGWPAIAGAKAVSYEFQIPEPTMVRPGQLDAEFRLEPSAPHVRVLYDGFYMTEEYVRDFVGRVVRHASGAG
jgi:hypothetical protein